MRQEKSTTPRDMATYPRYSQNDDARRIVSAVKYAYESLCVEAFIHQTKEVKQ